MTAADRPHFIITGCARSGTGYTASLLSHLGVECTHEALFTPYSTTFPGFGEPRGDSSWLAVPFLDLLPAGTVVLHQVRDPEAVIASLVGIRFFSDDGTKAGRDLRSRWQVARARGFRQLMTRLTTKEGRSRARRRRSDFVAFLRRYNPEIFAEPDERRRAARYWIAWNDAAARAADQRDLVYMQYRLEDIDAALTSKLLALVGGTADSATIDGALAELSKTTNTRPQARTALPAESSLLDMPGYGAAVERYGYETARPR